MAPAAIAARIAQKAICRFTGNSLKRWGINVRRLILAVAISSLVAPVAAQNQDETARTVRGFSNFHQEHVACIAYYSIGRSCLDPSRDALAVEAASASIARLATASAEVAGWIGLSNDATVSRLQMELNGQRRLIQNHCVNLSSLLSRYAERCKRLVENGDEVLYEHLDR